jgi:hypothetical protein
MPSGLPGRRAAATVAVVLAVGVVLTGCSGGNSRGDSTSVFKVSSGECFVPPEKVQAELTKIDQVPCNKAHTQEAYASVAYKASTPSFDSLTADYPGETVLKQFADGACAQRFSTYVGVDYQDSSLFFTYLIPSARSWQQAHDRRVVCFITTTGSLLRKSVKGSKL